MSNHRSVALAGACRDMAGGRRDLRQGSRLAQRHHGQRTKGVRHRASREGQPHHARPAAVCRRPGVLGTVPGRRSRDRREVRRRVGRHRRQAAAALRVAGRRPRRDGRPARTIRVRQIHAAQSALRRAADRGRRDVCERPADAPERRTLELVYEPDGLSRRSLRSRVRAADRPDSTRPHDSRDSRIRRPPHGPRSRTSHGRAPPTPARCATSGRSWIASPCLATGR